VDAYVIQGGERVACGRVLCDANDRWINGFTGNLGHCFIMVTEVWGLITTLKHG